MALYAGRQRRIIIIIIISAALNELKNRFCSGVLFEISVYVLDRINPGMKIEYE